MRKKWLYKVVFPFTSLMIFIFLLASTSFVSPLHAQNKKPYPFNVAVESRFGIQREQLTINDPGGRLATRPDASAFYGLGLSFSTSNERIRLTMDIDHSTVGRKVGWPGYGQNAGWTFWRFHPQFEYQIKPTNFKQFSKWRLLLKAGPSYNFFRSYVPNEQGFSNYHLINPPNDTIRLKLDTSNVQRGHFFALGGSIGLNWRANHRLNINLSFGGSFALGGDIASHKIVYKDIGMSNRQTATVANTGSMTTTTLGIRYIIGATPKTLQRRAKEGRKGIDTAFLNNHRWQLQLLTSNFYPSISLADPGGHLGNQLFQRFTYGARLRYKVAPSWYVSAGFETFPFALDARPTNQYFGFTDIQVNNAVQLPIMAEYKWLSTKGAIKMDFIAGAGISMGIQRQWIREGNPTLPGWVHTQPLPYYEDAELREGPGKVFWAPTANLQAQWHISRHIFLHGYVRYQHDVSNQDHFMQLRAAYRYGSENAPAYEAKYGQSPTALMPGFGVGFKW